MKIRHRASGMHGVRFFATVPLSLLKFSAGIPEGPGKSLKSDFPQEESLKVTILTGGVSAKLAGRAFCLDENTVPGPNVAKTHGGDPPQQKTSPLGRPGGRQNPAFFLRCSESLSEPPFSRCRGQLGGPWTPKRSLQPHFGFRLGTNLAPNWR